MLGYTQSDFYNLEVEQSMQLIHPEDRQATTDLLQKLNNHEIETFEEQQRLLRKDGTIVRVNATVKASWDMEGNKIVTTVSLEAI